MIKFRILLLFIVVTSALLPLNNSTQYHTPYGKFIKERINYVTIKEYSTHIDKVYIGLINYPQWFVTLHSGILNGLTMFTKVEGSESLYPTNVTQQRWMSSFDYSTSRAVNLCKERIKHWHKDKQLELAMYSQAMVICLSSNTQLLDNDTWYEKCWKGYHSTCRVNKDDLWI